MTLTRDNLTREPTSRKEPQSPPQVHSPSPQRCPTPPRSTTACEDLASSVLLSFHHEESDRIQTDAAVAEDRVDKSENILLLNLTKDDKITRDHNIKKMLVQNYFRYAMDGSLRNLIVDQLFREVNALERSEIIRDMLNNVDEQALGTILKTFTTKMQTHVPNADATSRKRDGEFRSPGPGVKRGRLGVENHPVAPPGPSFKNPAGHHDIPNTSGPQTTVLNPQTAAFRSDLASFTRPFRPPGTVDSARFPVIGKDLDHLLSKNTTAVRDSPFNRWSSSTQSPPNMRVDSKAGMSQKRFPETLRSHTMRTLKSEMEKISAPHPGAHYTPGEAPSFPHNQNALNLYSKANRSISHRYQNLLTQYTPDVMMSKLSFSNSGPSYNSQMFASYHQTGGAPLVYKNKQSPAHLKEPSREPVMTPRAEVFICPVNDCRKVMRAQRVYSNATFFARRQRKHLIHILSN